MRPAEPTAIPRHPRQPGAIWLIGMMGAGKSTIGRLLAERLGRAFVDLDERIAREAGRAVHEIIALDGEAAFRAREAQAVRAVAVSDPDAVIATGGGAPCFGDSLAAMQQTGLVVWIRAGVDEVLARTDVSTRPLLQGGDPRRRWLDLERSRRAFYGRAHLVIARDKDSDTDTDRQAIPHGVHVSDALHLGDHDERRGSRHVADLIARFLSDYGDAALVPEPVRTLWVELGERRYPIFLDDKPGAESRFAAQLALRLPPGRTRLGLVSDERVAALHLPRVRAALEQRGYRVVTSLVPEGEASKSIAQAERVAEQLSDGGLDRDAAVVALGGGVIGDLAGFVASVLFRGIALVQAPTTLMAMVDSSVGGKTGVNLGGKKNLIGSFHQPALVYADLGALATLSARDRSAGLGEVAKHALLVGGEALRRLEACADRAAAGAPEILADLIAESCELKARVVAADEHERDPDGGRTLLNLGHTVGHALETDSYAPASGAAPSPLRHGEAVALGLLAAARIGAQLDTAGLADTVAGIYAPALAEPGLEARIAALLVRLGLPIDLDARLTPGALDSVRADKKRAGGPVSKATASLRYVALPAPGAARIVPLEPSRLAQLLASHQPTQPSVAEVVP